VVDQLQTDYRNASKNVLMLEYNVDGTRGWTRPARWWTAFGAGGSATLPLIDVDSGFRTTMGSVDFGKVYKRMIDEALRRKAGVDLLAAYKVVNNDVVVTMRVTNRAGVTLSSGNATTLNAVIWLEKKILHTGRTAVAEQVNGLCGKPLLNGETATCVVTMKDKAKDLGTAGQVLAIVDYRPNNNTGPYESLNAAHAIKGELPPLVGPTAEPTVEPTQAPPEPTPTLPPIVIDMPPTVKSPIADIAVTEEEPVASIDLSKVFADADSDPTQMTFEVSKNSNAALLTPTINGSMLDLAIAAGQTGSAEISIRCSSDGKSVSDTFTLTVKAKNLPPGPTGGKVYLPWLER
jgi:hypothetical protein